MSVRSPARPQRPASAELQRRRDLRRRKRVHFAAQLWSLLLLLSASAGLGWLLLRHGWLLRTPEQVQLTSRSPFNREQVISAAGLRFPVALLSLDGASLQQRLGAKLPVEDIRLQRQLWPPQLLIDLRLRQAVARAQRHTPQGRETGYVDRTGAWISRAQQQQARGEAVPALRVLGWQPRHAGTIALLLRELPSAAAISQMEFRRNGELWMQSKALGPVRFGSLDQRLPRQLEVLSHLAEQQPLAQEPTQALDLSDPERPELMLVPPKSSEN